MQVKYRVCQAVAVSAIALTSIVANADTVFHYRFENDSSGNEFLDVTGNTTTDGAGGLGDVANLSSNNPGQPEVNGVFTQNLSSFDPAGRFQVNNNALLDVNAFTVEAFIYAPPQFADSSGTDIIQRRTGSFSDQSSLNGYKLQGTGGGFDWPTLVLYHGSAGDQLSFTTSNGSEVNPGGFNKTLVGNGDGTNVKTEWGANGGIDGMWNHVAITMEADVSALTVEAAIIYNYVEVARGVLSGFADADEVQRVMWSSTTGSNIFSNVGGMFGSLDSLVDEYRYSDQVLPISDLLRIPEPSTFSLMGLVLAGTLVSSRKRG